MRKVVVDAGSARLIKGIVLVCQGSETLPGSGNVGGCVSDSAKAARGQRETM